LFHANRFLGIELLLKMPMPWPCIDLDEFVLLERAEVPSKAAIVETSKEN